ncbi:MAG: AI-2E family transporter [Acetatifactor muris]|nr:AI-2E family transporter [Acetatifactor muris]MCM1525718.1 AI-2E family transporter [Bacteroides sp.]
MWEKIKENRFALIFFLTGTVWFFLKYISPLISPVLIAMLFVTIFGPLLKKMQGRLHLHRQVGAVVLLAAAVLFLTALLWILFSWIVGSLPGWMGELNSIRDELQLWVHKGCEAVGNLVGVDGFYLENTILNAIGEGMDALGKHTLPGVLSQSLAYVKILGTLGGFLVTFLIATVLLAKDYDDIMNRLLDREECHVMLKVICGVIRYIATYVKAQTVIMVIIGLTAAVTLGIAGVYHGVLWGILAGFLDALPFVGTGIVLMPLALLQLVHGSYGRGAVCILLYLICIFLRELLEPRLIGKRMGVPAIAVLVSLYVGIRLFGVWGIVKGPLGFVLIRECYLNIEGARGGSADETGDSGAGGPAAETSRPE